MTKYGAIKTQAHGLTFDSKGEAARYTQLLARLQHGEITNLRRQVKYRIEINGVHVCDYIADFVYTENGAEVVEDFKGYITPVYRLKAKLMRAVHGVTVRETS